MTPLRKVTGLGGVFLRVNDVAAMKAWYDRCLGLPDHPYGSSFAWHPHGHPEQTAYTNWSFFSQDNAYFPTEQPAMINFRVADLEALLEDLRQQGVTQVGELEKYPYGNFAWILDPEGNKIELWEPVDSGFGEMPEGVVK